MLLRRLPLFLASPISYGEPFADLLCPNAKRPDQFFTSRGFGSFAILTRMPF
jgi:hypothetical protein